MRTNRPLYILSGAMLMLLLALTVSAPAMSLLEGVILLVKEADKCTNAIDGTLESLASNKAPLQTYEGSIMDSKLKDLSAQTQKVVGPEPVNINGVVTWVKLLSPNFIVRENEINKARVYVRTKEKELDVAREMIMQLEILGARVTRTQEGVAKISKGFQETPDLLDVGFLKIAADIETSLNPAINGVISTTRTKAAELSSAVATNEKYVSNISQNLDTLTEITRREKAQVEAFRARRIKYDLQSQAFQRRVKEHNAKKEKFNQQGSVIKCDLRDLESLEYTVCPNKHSFKDCNHSELKRRWLDDKEAKREKILERRASWKSAIEFVGAEKEELQKEADELAGERKFLVNERKRIETLLQQNRAALPLFLDAK